MLIICLWVSLAMSCTGITGYHYRTQNKLQAKGREQTTLLRRRVLDLQHYPRRQDDGYHQPEHPHFNNTHFCPIQEMEQSGARLVDEEDYPWIARVVHGRPFKEIMAPLICTAAAIDKEIFITAARCIATAKAEFTTVLYLNRQIGVKAFIFPVEPSKQMFDDVGLIVTWAPWQNKTIHYEIINLPKNPRPDDNSYYFFEDLVDTKAKTSTLIGFIELEESPGTHKLYKLENMHASNRICNEIYPMTKNSDDYWAPCVHFCSPEEHDMNSETCRRYLLGLGHMVVDEQTNELIGIVTWTCANSAPDRLSRDRLPMPLGVAVPNRKTLKIDKNCADMLTNDKMPHTQLTRGYYRHLCMDMY
ncbi:uncharacterized protein LOC133525867 [Cydia pomonella]|uniref:uncharacterized protein LOC133525867 n=1 Tax=Cydia pomonella TaxID=82600 RepID=UPI002ADD77EA|nr:uncharacterized protein LOC133525867 [Cydia pomonella]